MHEKVLTFPPSFDLGQLITWMSCFKQATDLTFIYLAYGNRSDNEYGIESVKNNFLSW